ncbi:MAG: CapA family protein [Defluviitaleaceae bacterium]|nr:CapA family protein [Defluviitaleaceae bacterium]
MGVKLKTALLFIFMLIIFGGITIALYHEMIFYFGRTQPDAIQYVEAFAPITEPEPVVYSNEDTYPPEDIFTHDIHEYDYQHNNSDETPDPHLQEPYEPEPQSNIITITLSAAGDTTLGGDRRWAGYHAFMREFENSGRDHSHFLRNIAHIFYESDLSIVNLEGTLTYAQEHEDKQFAFRGPPHFAQILSSSHVDAVTISNNHTIDFFRRGYEDTVAALQAEDIAYFGNEFKTIMDVNGIQVGMYGYRIWQDTAENRNRIRAAIEYLQDRGAQLIIAYYHWGVERDNFPQQYQINIGRYTIRNGAHLVLGAHPHVVQGIEQYMGRFIVYSLANFSFGGNANPPDQDSFIFQQTFSFYNGVLLPDANKNVIPIFVSSVRYRNDFRPTIAEGADGERILARIERYSEWLR